VSLNVFRHIWADGHEESSLVRHLLSLETEWVFRQIVLSQWLGSAVREP
jgi:hypothetical protein